MIGIRRAVGMVLLAAVSGCSGGAPMQGEWSGQGPDSAAVGFAFDDDGTGSEARGDTVREFTYRLDARYDPARLELVGRGWSEQGVVRFVGDHEMRMRLTASVGRGPRSFTPHSPGLLLVRRELR